MQYNIFDYSPHAVHYILMTYLFYNREFVLLIPFTHFAHSPHPLLLTTTNQKKWVLTQKIFATGKKDFPSRKSDVCIWKNY